MGTLLMWTEEGGVKHTKRIYNSTNSGIPLCQTAPTYTRYKNFLRNYSEYQVDDKHLVSMYVGAELQLEHPYIHTLDGHTNVKHSKPNCP
jgi:hypothetical protein